MTWINYETGKHALQDYTLYWVYYKDVSGVYRYDSGSFKKGKPWVVGNHLAFDIVAEVIAFAEIIPYST